MRPNAGVFIQGKLARVNVALNPYLLNLFIIMGFSFGPDFTYFGQYC